MCSRQNHFSAVLQRHGQQASLLYRAAHRVATDFLVTIRAIVIYRTRRPSPSSGLSSPGSSTCPRFAAPLDETLDTRGLKVDNKGGMGQIGWHSSESQEQGCGKAGRRSEGVRAAWTGAEKEDGVMRGIHAAILVVSISLLVCGCAGLRRAQGTAPAPTVGPAEPCLEAHGFTVLSFRAVRDSYDRISIVGEIKNTSSATRGVELQASLRDAGGRVVAVGHFCPASNRNIIPEETWPFTYSFGRQEDAAEAELRIVGAFRTMDILNVASTTP